MVFVLPIHDENRPSRRPYVTWGLIAANVAVFVFLFLQGSKAQNNAFSEYGAIPTEILQGRRLWTLVTSMFIHADILHLLGNMLFLWIFGDNIEDTLGRGKYLIFYFVGGFIATFAHIGSTLISQYTSITPYFTPELDIPTIGASGAISATLGAYMVLYPHSRIRTFIFVVVIITFASVPAYFYLGFWFLYQVLMGFGALIASPSNVAFWAHIGGYIYGMIIVKALGTKPIRRRRIQELPVGPTAAPLTISPLGDVLIDDNKVTVLVNMPGLERENIKVNVSKWNVAISAELRDLRFHKQIALPVPVIPQVQNLAYNNGVLSFTLTRTH
jgi:membrane associated rhomboid family serine protease